ncbi:Protein of unknown function [Pyronema omphalodes CBS 100304]|uniref:Uncharacterized protein n=1 Tax=Pyronema omphalodes (strain CBS 100304) TaxID=1076935 RepID=U4L7W4_PYROM|nr:Protein of unknown function [Pyronema omphalodes CBS 100304]
MYQLEILRGDLRDLLANGLKYNKSSVISMTLLYRCTSLPKSFYHQ